MNAARRSRRRSDWPRGLYEPRPGYYLWRHPTTGRSFALGSIPLASAKHQALQANAHLEASRPSLMDRLIGRSSTVAELLDQMPLAERDNTRRNHRSQDKAIRAALGDTTCLDLSTADCAQLVEGIGAEHPRMAQAVRSRLIAVCKRGQQLGWLDANPAEPTARPAVVVKRRRLTLPEFNAIRARAGEVNEWLELAMTLALVSAQDRSTIAGMTRRQVQDLPLDDGTTARFLVVERPKTSGRVRPVAIPLTLRLDAIDVGLAELLERRTGVLSKHVLHHVRPYGNAPAGSPVSVDRISRAFTAARELAGITGDDAPTFHELRSLSLRLYRKQGGIDTKTLAGHTQDKTHALYQDGRGIEPMRVQVNAK